MNSLRQNKKGFTIIELMIATSVFTVVLLLCSYGFVSIGRAYYKGITTTRTQETARGIIEEITDSIQFGGSSVTKLAQTKDGIDGFCIASRRFSYKVGVQRKNKSIPVLTVDNGCTASSSPSLTGQELMGLRMRLSNLTIEPMKSSPNLYRITVRVISGDDDLIDDIDKDGYTECKNVRAGAEFCAWSELTTVVERRV